MVGEGLALSACTTSTDLPGNEEDDWVCSKGVCGQVDFRFAWFNVNASNDPALLSLNECLDMPSSVPLLWRRELIYSHINSSNHCVSILVTKPEHWPS